VKPRRKIDERRPAARKNQNNDKTSPPLRMFLVPCSCGLTFAVAENYDRQGTAWGRYLPCPRCGKRHDPKNRLLTLGFHSEGYWKVDAC
jgi:hydrogenase maturation factor HypF (carbamoyltransferase family)